MSTLLSEPQASGHTTETRPDVTAGIEEILQSFDVLSSRGEKHIFRYAYLYFFGLCSLGILFITAGGMLSGYTEKSSNFSRLTGIEFISSMGMASINTLLAFVWISLFVWTFNVWREHVPHILRGIFEKKCLSVPIGDVNTHYLGFLESYRDALKSPKRYLLVGLVGSLLVILVAVYFLPVINSIFISHQGIGDIIFWGVFWLVIFFFDIGASYCVGIIAWALCISGWYIRKLSRAFELRIEPVHPDHCGGLQLLGNFCFGSASPPFIGFVFFCGYLFVMLSTYAVSPVTAKLVPVLSGFAVFLLCLYTLPLTVFTFVLPLWNIHKKMLRERETAEQTYTTNIAPLREQIQIFLPENRLEEAQTMKEKKTLLEVEYIPYPTWPFNVRAKLFSTVLGAGGSFLLGFLTALPPIILQAIFKP